MIFICTNINGSLTNTADGEVMIKTLRVEATAINMSHEGLVLNELYFWTLSIVWCLKN
jgi:hypothetical protein